ncbi:MAG: NAD+ synthase [Rhodospirillaceae bacterium]|jgi:NAD+ synthase|nr:NAD+ synthase [Rhodospirillaceae bacterium]MBT6202641.1 NAD+ synthase [Rhodospirillaceae bacterium]
MTDPLKIALAQLNPTVGAVEANADKVLDARRQAAEQGADLLVTPELVINGYPPEDLVLRPAFQEQVEAAVARIAAATADGGPAVLLGATHRNNGDLFNAVYLLDGGETRHVRLKYDLPNYGVFDEKRVFTPGPLPGPIPFRDVRLGVMICEDMWTGEVAECLEESGAELLIVPNGSPYDIVNIERRMNQAVARVTETELPIIYVNQVGGQDELVFDGASFVLDAERNLRAQLPAWTEAVVTTTWQRTADGWACEMGEVAPEQCRFAMIYQAMVTGLADYVGKNGFPGVLIGMSGGIDSALSAAVAADALGPDRVHCVMMPSRYTSQESLDDAALCSDLLGVRHDSVSIAPAVGAYDTMLDGLFVGTEPNEAEENIQARSRGMTLMALSNKFGHMVLSTGNKSEMSVGYATLYGDMCGGYSVLKDVYKVTVYALSDWRNRHHPDGLLGREGLVIPQNIIDKAPTAELKDNQTDQDSLPPYDVLDDILDGLVEKEETFEKICARGHERDLVERVWGMLLRAEYKRRQAPPGVKITSRAFGRDRRYPITNRFRS